MTALEGSGTYHLQAEIIGTAERLAKEAILNREVPLQIECHWYRCHVLIPVLKRTISSAMPRHSVLLQLGLTTASSATQACTCGQMAHHFCSSLQLLLD